MGVMRAVKAPCSLFAMRALYNILKKAASEEGYETAILLLEKYDKINTWDGK
jgi:hypothetical protein